MDDEAQFEAAVAFSALYGWLFAWLDEGIEWMVRSGLGARTGRDMVLQTVSGALQMSAASNDSAASILESLATPGGLTEHGLQVLTDRGGIRSWIEALDSVTAKIRTAGP
jgi:pyrroline-5-carboxylate reductase